MASTAESFNALTVSGGSKLPARTAPTSIFAGNTCMLVKRSFSRNSLVTFSCMPIPKLTMETSAPMPMTTPSVVSTLRSFVLHRFSRDSRNRS